MKDQYPVQYLSFCYSMTGCYISASMCFQCDKVYVAYNPFKTSNFVHLLNYKDIELQFSMSAEIDIFLELI